MSNEQCPVCYAVLTERDVSPCFVCGGWQATSMSSDLLHEWRLASGATIVLCQMCELEEFRVPGGLGRRVGQGKTNRPIDAMQYVRRVEMPTVCRDKYCSECRLRLAFLKLISE